MRKENTAIVPKLYYSEKLPHSIFQVSAQQSDFSERRKMLSTNKKPRLLDNPKQKQNQSHKISLFYYINDNSVYQPSTK